MRERKTEIGRQRGAWQMLQYSLFLIENVNTGPGDPGTRAIVNLNSCCPRQHKLAREPHIPFSHVDLSVHYVAHETPSLLFPNIRLNDV